MSWEQQMSDAAKARQAARDQSERARLHAEWEAEQADAMRVAGRPPCTVCYEWASHWWSRSWDWLHQGRMIVVLDDHVWCLCACHWWPADLGHAVAVGSAT